MEGNDGGEFFGMKEENMEQNFVGNREVNMADNMDFMSFFEELSVSNEEECRRATEIFLDLLREKKKVEKLYQPLKEVPFGEHKAVCREEKRELAPFLKAEVLLEEKITEFLLRREELAEIEQLGRRLEIEEAIGEKFFWAEELERCGDRIGAEKLLYECGELQKNLGCKSNLLLPLARGVRFEKCWRVCAVEEEKVPVKVGGVMVRPVDVKRLEKLKKESLGEFQLDGVKFQEFYSVKGVLRG